jgi:nitrogen fixation protein NifU and related proteins
MTDILKELYRDKIIDLYNNPPHKAELENNTHESHGHNPTCGDNIMIRAIVDQNNVIKQIKYTGEGCAISQAALNLLIEELENKEINSLEKIDINKIKELLGVDISHARENCASLGLNTCKKMLASKDEEK